MTSPLSQDPSHAIPVASRLRTSRRRWRFAALVAVLLAIAVGYARFGPAVAPGGGTYIARVRIDGVIGHDPARLKTLADLAANPKVAAVILAINSPGGSSAGGEELYRAIGRLRAKKPVVSVISELGASAAYMTAIAADRVYARDMSMVGAIGVYIQHVSAGKLLDTIGVNIEKVTSGPLKGKPDLTRPMAPDVRQSLQDVIDDSFKTFVNMVAERRGLTKDQTRTLADGRIYSGLRGQQDKLIDAIGGETEAISWLQDKKGVKAGLPVRTVYPHPATGLSGLTKYLQGQAKSLLGLGTSDPEALDGLVSLWHFDPRS